MNTYIELALLSAVVVYIVDLSGWSDTLLRLASRFTRRYGYGPVTSLRPFTCSLCMVWWCGLAWCWFRQSLDLPHIAAVAGLSFFSITLTQILIFLREALLGAVTWITGKLWNK